MTRDRPSTHGAWLGETLAAIADAGRVVDPTIPEACVTCAFRSGSMPNQMGATALTAFHCVIGTDPSPFGCHHTMKDGEPTRMCAGFYAARKAPLEVVKAEVKKLNNRLADLPPEDRIRAEFDAWIAKLDPENKLDDYARARAYAKEVAHVGS